MSQFQTIKALPTRAEIDVVFFDVGHTLLWPDVQQIANFINTFFIKDLLHHPTTPVEVLIAEQNIRHHCLHPDTWTDAIPEGVVQYFGGILSGVLFSQGAVEFPCPPKPSKSDRYPLFLDACYKYHQRNHWFNIIGPDALNALRKLHWNGVPMAIISNANGNMTETLKQTGLLPFFAEVIDSGTEGVSKPDPEIFTRALDRMGVSAERALHIGDHPVADVQGALGVGIQPVHYDPQWLYPTFDSSVPQINNLTLLGTALSYST